MNKAIIVFLFLALISSCSITEKNIEKFAYNIIQDFVKKDSVSLFNKIMDGETSGEYGFLYFINYDEQHKPSKEFVEISKKRYEESKENVIHALSNQTYRFHDWFGTESAIITSVALDTLLLNDEKEITNLLNKKKATTRYYQAYQIVKNESGDSIFSRISIMELNNKLYFTHAKFSKERIKIK